MSFTLAEILLALPGAWQPVQRKSPTIRTPPQRERAELDLNDHLMLVVEVHTQDAQARRQSILGRHASPLPFEVYLLNAQGYDAAPGVLGLATTADEAVAVAADKVTRAILYGREIRSLPPWLAPKVAERLRQTVARAQAAADAFTTNRTVED